MTLLRLIQRASILAGMTFAGLSVHSNPAHSADTPQICVIASNGKTECGTLQAVERACIITDNSRTVCGKFKSAKGIQEQRQETNKPSQSIVARKEVGNVVFALKGCRKSDTNVKCELTITNKGVEKNIGFAATGSTFIDIAGKSHNGSTGDVGGQSSAYTVTTITPGIDYSASITFENIPDQVVKAQLLNLNFGGSVQFRNVAFSN